MLILCCSKYRIWWNKWYKSLFFKHDLKWHFQSTLHKNNINILFEIFLFAVILYSSIGKIVQPLRENMKFSSGEMFNKFWMVYRLQQRIALCICGVLEKNKKDNFLPYTHIWRSNGNDIGRYQRHIPVYYLRILILWK